MPNLDDVILSVDGAATMLAQYIPDLSDLHSDLTKHKFRLFTNWRHDVVISAFF